MENLIGPITFIIIGIIAYISIFNASKHKNEGRYSSAGNEFALGLLRKNSVDTVIITSLLALSHDCIKNLNLWRAFYTLMLGGSIKTYYTQNMQAMT